MCFARWGGASPTVSATTSISRVRHWEESCWSSPSLFARFATEANASRFGVASTSRKDHCSAARFRRASACTGPRMKRRPSNPAINRPRHPGGNSNPHVNVTREECSSNGTISMTSSLTTANGR